MEEEKHMEANDSTDLIDQESQVMTADILLQEPRAPEEDIEDLEVPPDYYQDDLYSDHDPSDNLEDSFAFAALFPPVAPQK